MNNKTGSYLLAILAHMQTATYTHIIHYSTVYNSKSENNQRGLVKNLYTVIK